MKNLIPALLNSEKVEKNIRSKKISAKNKIRLIKSSPFSN